MQQTNFFTEPKNTRTREYMLTCKLQSDLLNAAGNRGYPLQIYLPTVDRDGFDIIFSDKQTLAPIQLKSTITKRSDWKIHRKFFRPRYQDFGAYSLFSSSHESGTGGGVILIDIEEENGILSAKYAYSDYLIIRLISSGRFNFSQRRINSAKTALLDMTDSIDGSFTLKRPCFLGAPTPDHLLSLMGLASNVQKSWRNEWLEYLSLINDKSTSSTWKDAPEEFLSLITDSFSSIEYT
mgnify:CR=1 FL=1